MVLSLCSVSSGELDRELPEDEARSGISIGELYEVVGLMTVLLREVGMTQGLMGTV